MIREIFEEPKVVIDTLTHVTKTYRETKGFNPNKFEMVYITGSGTSYHAGLAGGYSLSYLASIGTSVVQASEFPIWIPPSARNFLLIAFSQSGESIDILAAAKATIEKRGEILAITNTVNSSLAKMAKLPIITQAGKELAVTATKTYVAQLSAIYQLSIELAESINKISKNEASKLRSMLQKAHVYMEKILRSQNENIMEIAEKYKENNFIFLLGSGPNYATALEGALKLKESCNIFAEGHAAREFLHGPMQLVNEKTPMFFIIPPKEEEIKEWVNLMNRFKKFGAPSISISYKNENIIENATDSILIPKGIHPVFTPMLYVVPLQLFSYYTSIARGYNPDAPEKLSKVVK